MLTIRLAAAVVLAMVPLLQLLAKMLHGEARINAPGRRRIFSATGLRRTSPVLAAPPPGPSPAPFFERF